MIKRLNDKKTNYKYYLTKEEALYFKGVLFENRTTIVQFCNDNNIESVPNFHNALAGRVPIGIKYVKSINDYLKLHKRKMIGMKVEEENRK